ncbi:Peroxisomal coenzyme A diphosphatase nudt7 [Chytriomyces hyalinus]|nr:Peroxisomal coenzyme A diphosphatase nudt7 [Chytriomyces hyalinus]
MTANTCVVDGALRNLRRYAKPNPDHEWSTFPNKRASVLVPLIADRSTDTLHVILTQRVSGLRTHSGEVALPGGKSDETDVDEIHTATREAQEEIGLDASFVEIISTHEPAYSLHRILVTPVTGLISDAILASSLHQNNGMGSFTANVLASLTPNPEEVAAVFTVPLDHFLRKNGHGEEFVVLEGETQAWRSYTFDYTDEFGGRYYIWGLTAYILVNVAMVAYGRHPDFECILASERPSNMKSKI